MPDPEGPDDGHRAFVAARRDVLVQEHGGGPVVEAAVDRALARCRRGWRRLEREDDVEARVRDQIGLELDRPRRRRIGLRVVGVLLLVALAGVLWSFRPQPPAVAQEVNSLPVPWYDGTDLHLSQVRVTLPGLGPFVADGDGVIVRWEGELRRVDADGELTSYSGAVDLGVDTTTSIPPVGPADRVLQSVDGPSDMTLHLVEMLSSDPDAGTYVRLSETGRRVFISCTPYSCVSRLVEAGARLR